MTARVGPSSQDDMAPVSEMAEESVPTAQTEPGRSDATGDAQRAHDQVTSLGGTLDGTLIDRIGIDILEAEPDRVVARMPVDGNRQPFGLLHGGATGALCETVGSLGASLAA